MTAPPGASGARSEATSEAASEATSEAAASGVAAAGPAKLAALALRTLLALGPLLALAPLLSLGACGGAPPPPPAKVKAPPPLCAVESPLGAEKAPRDRTYPPGYWLALLLKGYHAGGELDRPTTDCRGTKVEIAQDGCANDPQPDLLPATPLAPGDVVVLSLGEGRRLVWAMTERFSDGEAQGPVAIAEIEAKGISVRGLGVLRAFPHNLSLRLEKLGGGTVLVADGEHCHDGQAAESCERSMRLLPLVGDRFLAKPLVDENGVCLGRALLPVRSAGTATGAKGVKYQIETLVTFNPDAVLVREHLALDGLRRSADPASASYVTRVQADRQITMRGENLVATGASLLARWQATSNGAASNGTQR